MLTEKWIGGPLELGLETDCTRELCGMMDCSVLIVVTVTSVYTFIKTLQTVETSAFYCM